MISVNLDDNSVRANTVSCDLRPQYLRGKKISTADLYNKVYISVCIMQFSDANVLPVRSGTPGTYTTGTARRIVYIQKYLLQDKIFCLVHRTVLYCTVLTRTVH
jgi:hypothetical protein